MNNYDTTTADAQGIFDPLAGLMDTADAPVFPVCVYYDGKKWQKKPLCGRGHLDRKPRAEWGDDWPAEANAAGVVPADLGMVVLDLDTYKGLHINPAFRRALPRTLTIRSPSGGYHCWYRTTEKFGNGRGGLPAGVDVRSGNGWVPLPGSCGLYHLLCYPDLGIAIDVPAPLPDAVRNLLRSPQTSETAKSADYADEDHPVYLACARRYLATLPEDHDGWPIAAALVRNFGLTDETAAGLWNEWQADFDQQWDDDAIATRLASARKPSATRLGDAVAHEAWLAAGRTGNASRLAPVGLDVDGTDDPVADAIVTKRTAPTVRLNRGASYTPRKIDWLWHGWLARGKYHVLAGEKGAGKSTLTFSLLATITTGGRWPDGSKAPRGDVLVWSAEDDFEDTILPRFMAAGGDRNRLYNVAGVTDNGGDRPFDPGRDIEGLLDAARKLPGLKAVMVDPVVMAVAGDSHKNAETRRGLQPLVDFAEARGVALIGITHFTKGTDGKNPVERVTGSLAFAALARVVLAAAADENGNQRRLVRVSSNIGPSGGGVEYMLDQAMLRGYDFRAQHVIWGATLLGSAKELLEGVRGQSELLKSCQFLVDTLAAGAVAVSDLKRAAEANGFTWRTIERAKAKLNSIAAFQNGGAWFWRGSGMEQNTLGLAAR